PGALAEGRTALNALSITLMAVRSATLSIGRGIIVGPAGVRGNLSFHGGTRTRRLEQDHRLRNRFGEMFDQRVFLHVNQFDTDKRCRWRVADGDLLLVLA